MRHRVIVNISIPIVCLRIGGVRNDGIGRNESAQPRGIVAGIVVVQPQFQVLFLAGELAVGEGLGGGGAAVTAEGLVGGAAAGDQAATAVANGCQAAQSLS